MHFKFYLSKKHYLYKNKLFLMIYSQIKILTQQIFNFKVAYWFMHAFVHPSF